MLGFSAALLWLGTANVTSVLVGELDPNPNTITQQLATYGVAGPVRPDRLYEVKLAIASPFAAAQKALKERGFDFVLPVGADFVDKQDALSVRAHRDYLVAKSRLAGHAKGKERVGHIDAYESWLKLRSRDGQFDEDHFRRSIELRKQMPAAPIIRDNRQLSPFGSWSYIGPKLLDVPYQRAFGIPNLGGRKSGFAASPNSESLWVASSEGGVWKTTNGGSTWHVKSDDWDFLATNCIAMHPTNEDIVLVGTGDIDWNSSTYTGIMRTDDGGASWTNIPASTFGNRQVRKIIFHPDQPSIVLALTSSTLGSTNSGNIYISINAGQTWTVTSAPSRRWDDIDVSVSSGGVRTFWAVSGGYFKDKNGVEYGDLSNGAIYKSVNGGLNWTSVNPPNAGAGQVLMDVACSKVHPDQLYVLMPGSNQVWKTSTAGTNWTNMTPGFPSTLDGGTQDNWGQDSYDIYIDTAAEGTKDVVYVGLITLAGSPDGGNTWYDLGRCYEQTGTRVHADQQCILPVPGNPKYAWVGNDGGVFQMFWDSNLAGIGSPVFTSLNDGLNDFLTEYLTIHPTNSLYLMAGHQDNGTAASRGVVADWKNIGGGDGQWSAFDRSSPGIHYTSSQRLGSIRRYPSASSTSPLDVANPAWSNTEFGAPLIMAGTSFNELYVGADRKLKLLINPFPATWVDLSNDIGAVVELAAAPSDGRVIYTGAVEGSVWKRSSAGAGFLGKINGTTLPETDAIGCITVHPTRPNEVLVGTMGSDDRLYRCTNTSAAVPVWTDITGNLPAENITTVCYDPFDTATLYAGCDVGLYKSTNNGTSWTHMTGLPNAPVSEIKVGPDNDLYVATRGRGIWKLDIIQLVLQQLSASTLIEFGGFDHILDIRMNALTDKDVSVALKDNTSLFETPTSATIRLNTDHSTARIRTVPVTLSATRTVTATFRGTNLTADLTIVPAPTLTSLELQPNTVVGGQDVTGTVRINKVVLKATPVSLTDNSSLLTTPSSVTVPTGSLSANFNMSTQPVTTTATRTVTATFNGVSKTASITLTRG